MPKSTTPANAPKFIEQRGVGIFLNAVLFATNFLLFYFICFNVFPAITGFARLAICWIGAYSLTWIMALLAKGTARLLLTLILLALLYTVFMYKP